jgi:hypothetical protein
MIKRKIVSIALGLALVVPGLAMGQINANEPREVKPIAPARDVLNVGKETIERAKEASERIREEMKRNAENIREQSKDEVEKARENLKEAQNEAQDQLRTAREAVNDKVGQVSQEVLKAFQEKREQVKTEFEAKREEFKKELEAKREEMKQVIEERREDFKQRLSVVKDEVRKVAAEKLFNDLNSLNSRSVGLFNKSVDQIEAVLNRILSRSEKARANGVDVTTVELAANAVKISIQETRNFIKIQAGKTYTATVSGEDALRTELKATRDQLKQDLEAVREKVGAVREAVHEAATALAQIPKVDEMEIETSNSAPVTTSTSD